MAASVALPVLVSLEIFIVWKGTAVLVWLCLQLMYSYNPRARPTTTMTIAANTMIAPPPKRLIAPTMLLAVDVARADPISVTAAF